MAAHLPKYWVSGICIEDEWKGEFYATSDELLEWCEQEMHDEPVVCLVLDICDAQKVYEEWWERVKQKV